MFLARFLELGLLVVQAWGNRPLDRARQILNFQYGSLALVETDAEEASQNENRSSILSARDNKRITITINNLYLDEVLVSLSQKRQDTNGVWTTPEGYEIDFVKSTKNTVTFKSFEVKMQSTARGPSMPKAAAQSPGSHVTDNVEPICLRITFGTDDAHEILIESRDLELQRWDVLSETKSESPGSIGELGATNSLPIDFKNEYFQRGLKYRLIYRLSLTVHYRDLPIHVRQLRDQTMSDYRTTSSASPYEPWTIDDNAFNSSSLLNKFKAVVNWSTKTIHRPFPLLRTLKDSVEPQFDEAGSISNPTSAFEPLFVGIVPGVKPATFKGTQRELKKQVVLQSGAADFCSWTVVGGSLKHVKQGKCELKRWPELTF